MSALHILCGRQIIEGTNWEKTIGRLSVFSWRLLHDYPIYESTNIVKSEGKLIRYYTCVSLIMHESCAWRLLPRILFKVQLTATHSTWLGHPLSSDRHCLEVGQGYRAIRSSSPNKNRRPGKCARVSRAALAEHLRAEISTASQVGSAAGSPAYTLAVTPRCRSYQYTTITITGEHS